MSELLQNKHPKHYLLLSQKMLSVDMLFKTFDTKIFPILTYGAEIWSRHKGIDIENTIIFVSMY